MQGITIEPIAYIHNDFSDKFGIPRQSNLIQSITSTIVFEKKYRDDNALRGLEDYSHIWLIWHFSQAETCKEWSATVRPPRLGGNKRMGVFATRSPFHPNRLGLSCVKIESIEKSKNDGYIIKVSGADLMDGTPIFDIKPYLAFTDSHTDAVCGFADSVLDYELEVIAPDDIKSNVEKCIFDSIEEILKQDPRPSYHSDPERLYGITYAGYNIKFRVDNRKLFIESISKKNVGEQ